MGGWDLSARVGDVGCGWMGGGGLDIRSTVCVCMYVNMTAYPKLRSDQIRSDQRKDRKSDIVSSSTSSGADPTLPPRTLHSSPNYLVLEELKSDLRS